MKKCGLLVLMFVVAVSGCAKKQIRTTTSDRANGGRDTTEASSRATDWRTLQAAKNIYFAYDKSDITPQARDILAANAKTLLAMQDIEVLVEGHCDERGTTEYNLALGQRRASAVRAYYGTLGVPLNRIATISYGKERPEDASGTEESWEKNRRAVTKIRKN